VGPGFGSYQTRAGDRLLMLREGAIPAEAMFQTAQEENRILTWILRAVGLILMLVGFTLIMAPLGVLADVVPLFGSIVRFGTGLIGLILTFLVGPFVMAVAWFWYRPVIAAIVMALGLALAYGVSLLAKRRAAARAARAMPPPPPMPPPAPSMQGWGR